jgi:hypothetical protein
VPQEMNSHATEMAKRYRDGSAEYRSDEKWFALVQEADNALLDDAVTPRSTALGATTGAPPVPGFGASARTETPPAPPRPQRTPIPSLTRDYIDPATNARWQVKAFLADEADPDLGAGVRPWHLGFQADQGVHTFLVNSRHAAFRSITLTPLDALLAELAWSATDAARQSRGAVPSFSASFVALREAYGDANALDAADMNADARGLLFEIARRVDAALDAADRSALYGQLPTIDQHRVLSMMMTRGVPSPLEAVANAGFLEYLPAAGLLRFFDDHPDLFFDGRCWDEPYAAIQLPAELIEERQTDLKRRYGAMLAEVIWLAEGTPETLEESSRERLLRARVAISALAPVA